MTPKPLTLFPPGPRVSVDPPRALSLVEQIRRAAQVRNRLAMLSGAVLGGFIPIAVYVVAHNETSARPPMWLLVAGGLAFSATTVYGFGRSAFGHPVKAAGFVVLMEGVLVFSDTQFLAWAALALLALINAVSTGVSLALEHQAYTRGKE